MNRCASFALWAACLCMPTSTLAQATPAAAAPQPTPDQAQILKNTEAFVRNLFAWGPEFKVTVGPLAPSISPAFYLAPVLVTNNERTDKGSVYVSKDGKTLVQGEMLNMETNPFAENLSKLHIDGNPSMGPADAKVTIVEFSDFQCPHCREFSRMLRNLAPKYPQIRIVFKDFPLTEIHPWAQTAAVGARCAYMQKPNSFWTIQDQIFENQDLISSENVWEKLAGFAAQDGLDADAFKACMPSPEPAQAVTANRRDGEALNVNSTPTAFINGRTVAGGDKLTVEQYIRFELSIRPGIAEQP